MGYNWVNSFRFLSYFGFPEKAVPEHEVILESPAREGGGWVRQGKEGSRCNSLWVMEAWFCRGPAEWAWSASQDWPTEGGGGISSIPPENAPPTLWVKVAVCVERCGARSWESLGQKGCSGCTAVEAGGGQWAVYCARGEQTSWWAWGGGRALTAPATCLHCLLLNLVHLHEEA